MKQPQPKTVEKEEPAIVLPKLGAIVFYRVSEWDAGRANKRRVEAAQSHEGNMLRPGDRLPLLVTKVSEKKFNGQLFLDGNDSLFIEYTKFGDNDGDCIEP